MVPFNSRGWWMAIGLNWCQLGWAWDWTGLPWVGFDTLSWEENWDIVRNSKRRRIGDTLGKSWPGKVLRRRRRRDGQGGALLSPFGIFGLWLQNGIYWSNKDPESIVTGVYDQGLMTRWGSERGLSWTGFIRLTGYCLRDSNFMAFFLWLWDDPVTGYGHRNLFSTSPEEEQEARCGHRSTGMRLPEWCLQIFIHNITVWNLMEFSAD